MTPSAPPHRVKAAGAKAAPLRELAGLSESALLERLGSSRAGLAADEVARRRTTQGPNQIASEGPPRWYQHLWHAWQTPFNYILLVLGVLSYITQDVKAVVVVGSMVALSTLLRFVQEFRSGRAAMSLQAMVRTTALVERTGVRVDIPIEELVEGDVVILAAGNMVPADLRVLQAKDLFVSQSALTGESAPVEKHAALPPGTALADDPLEIPLLAFMGTNIVSGSAVGVVLATGNRTCFGGLARDLLGRTPPTAFDLGVNRVSWLLVRFMAAMVPIVFVVNGLTKGDWVEAFLFGLAVAVGLTPEMLPMVVTANLAKGAVLMSRRKTIVKRLNAIQNLGAMEILCTDKTGTLTQDRVVLETHLNAAGEEDEAVLEFAFLNSYHQTGLRSLLDDAVLRHGELHAPLQVDRDYVKVDEIPFDFTRRRMSVVVERDGRHHLLITKGAVEEVIGACDRVRDEDRILPLSDQARRAVLDLAREQNEDGLRAVAVAYREFPAAPHAYGVADEQELIFVGFISFLDPPKETAGPALRSRGHTVGYLGDGINDAAALREADVGISVDTAVDVSREAADIILLEKSLMVLVEGVEEGRRTFGNIMKYLKMTASSNFGNVLSVVLASVALPFLPMLPVQLLVQNLLYDFSQVAIPWDRMDPDYLTRPRRWSADDIGRFMRWFGPVSSLFDIATFAVLWYAFAARTVERQALFQSGWFMEGLLTQTLIVHMIRTARVPFLESRAAAPVVLATIAVILVGLALPFTPVGAELGFVPVPPAYFPFLAAVAVAYAALSQLVKRWYIARFGVWL